MATAIGDYFDRRYKGNPYAGKNKHKIKVSTKQYPKRMYRAPKGNVTINKDEDNIPDQLTEEDFDNLLLPPHLKKKKEEESVDRSHLIGMELVNRHRYGDEYDILKAKFTKTKEEIEKEKFLLIIAARKLIQRLYWSMSTIPKHEKYILGGDIRNSMYAILRHSIGIKKRFYRKNMLEFIDVELDVLRELYRNANIGYPEWVDEKHLNLVLEDINAVGKIVGGLLKTTVC